MKSKHFKIEFFNIVPAENLKYITSEKFSPHKRSAIPTSRGKIKSAYRKRGASDGEQKLQLRIRLL